MVQIIDTIIYYGGNNLNHCTILICEIILVLLKYILQNVLIIMVFTFSSFNLVIILNKLYFCTIIYSLVQKYSLFTIFMN